MARKIDWSGWKEFFFNHGEKIALGACAFLALFLGTWDILGAWSARWTDGGKTWVQAFQERIDAIKTGMTNAAMPKADTSLLDEGRFGWKKIGSHHVPSPYSIFKIENDIDKRQNPRVLPIRSEEKNIRMVCITGLVFKHDYGYKLNQRVVYGLVPTNVEEVGPMPPPLKGPKQPKGVGVQAVIPPFVHVGQPQRMVVVHAVFPMKQQVVEFQKALRMASQDEMFVKSPDDLPRPVGIDVLRHEVLPNGTTKVTLLLGRDKDGLKVNVELEKLLREAIYDERSPEVLKEWIWAGFMTPMPKLANRSYPKFDIPGFEEVDWAAMDEPEKREMMAGAGGPVMDMPGKKVGLGGGLKGRPKQPPLPPLMQPEGGPKMAGVELKPKDIPESHLLATHPVLISRLFGGKEKLLERDINVYHVLGEWPRVIEKNNIQPGVLGPNPVDSERYFSPWHLKSLEAEEPGKQPMPPIIAPKRGGGVAAPPAVAYPNWERDALVRFIDVDVQPGKTYFYTVRVRLANPNFGKEDKVAFADLARLPELPPSNFVKTDPITIPQEHFVYPVDQQLVDDWAEGKGVEKKGTALTYNPSTVNSSTPFQVHQWVPKKTDNYAGVEYVIGDWAISERQLVRKGDFIGRGVTVQVPVWKKEKDAFEVPQNKHSDPKKAKGLHIDLIQDGRAPVLVDFVGGKRLAKNYTVEEETTVDALILMPDGRLKVFNSREASDPTINAVAQERQDRVLSARKRVRDVSNQGAAPDPKGLGPPLPPKGGGGQ